MPDDARKSEKVSQWKVAETMLCSKNLCMCLFPSNHTRAAEEQRTIRKEEEEYSAGNGPDKKEVGFYPIAPLPAKRR